MPRFSSCVRVALLPLLAAALFACAPARNDRARNDPAFNPVQPSRVLSRKPRRDAQFWLTAFLLAASWSATGTDPQPPETQAGLAGHYFSQDGSSFSKVVLHPDNIFGWELAESDQKHYMRGRWESSDGRLRLLVDKPGANKVLFEVTAARQWNDDAKQRLRRDTRLQLKRRAYEACPFLGTYEATGFSLLMNLAILTAGDPSSYGLKPRDAEQLKSYASDVEEARQVAERAIAAAVATLDDKLDDQSGRHVETLAKRDAADRAILDFWERYADASIAYFATGRSSDELPVLQFDQTRCINIAEYSVEPDAGYAVIVGENIPYTSWRTLPMRVEFIYSDGHREQRDLDETGWALVPVRASAHLRQVSLHPFDPKFPATTLDAVAHQPSIFDIRLDLSTIVQPPLEEATFVLGDREMLSPEHGWRYTCSVECLKRDHSHQPKQSP